MGFDQSYDEMRKRRTWGIILAVVIIILFTVFNRIRGGSSAPLQPVDGGLVLSGKNGEAQTFIRYDNIRDMELRTEFDPGTLTGEEGSMGGNYHYGVYENAELGQYMFYRYDRNDRYIVVKLIDAFRSAGGAEIQNVVFNYGSEEDTEEACRAFREAWQKYIAQ
ncbi:MAG: hypothetical protein J6P87_08785 [Lachnospiraceae bacterium]|nr:hypothetical protein [Lachnospiraceae bacterium]